MGKFRNDSLLPLRELSPSLRSVIYFCWVKRSLLCPRNNSVYATKKSNGTVPFSVSFFSQIFFLNFFSFFFIFFLNFFSFFSDGIFLSKKFEKIKKIQFLKRLKCKWRHQQKTLWLWMNLINGNRKDYISNGSHEQFSPENVFLWFLETSRATDWQIQTSFTYTSHYGRVCDFQKKLHKKQLAPPNWYCILGLNWHTFLSASWKWPGRIFNTVLTRFS